MSKTCGQCILWQKVKSIKDYGQCTVELPPWVKDNIEPGFEIIYKHSKMATHCPNFREEQEEVAASCSQEDEQMPVKYYQDNGKGVIHAVYGSSSIDYVEDLLKKNKELENKLYTAKVQESLTRPIVDEYGKAS